MGKTKVTPITEFRRNTVSLEQAADFVNEHDPVTVSMTPVPMPVEPVRLVSRATPEVAVAPFATEAPSLDTSERRGEGLRRGGRSRMTMDADPALVKRVKRYCIDNDMTVTDVLTAAIEQFFARTSSP